jgi:hypothetical protein
MNNNQELRVWWIPQVPMEPFHVEVSSILEARFIMKTLAMYDQFQFDNNVKPDYSNAGGLEVRIDGEWEEWISPCGDYIDDVDDNGESII